jgi:molybdopterin-containing oxidoreductase family iron-sulfur binding subunit
VRSYHEHQPAYHLDFPVGDHGIKPHQKGTVSKCNFCYHRIDQGLHPNCITVCPARARHFGDIEDKDSDVWQLLQTRKHLRLMVPRGTEPSVFFLI